MCVCVCVMLPCYMRPLITVQDQCILRHGVKRKSSVHTELCVIRQVVCFRACCPKKSNCLSESDYNPLHSYYHINHQSVHRKHIRNLVNSGQHMHWCSTPKSSDQISYQSTTQTCTIFTTHQVTRSTRGMKKKYGGPRTG